MIILQRYSAKNKTCWDNFILTTRQQSILFHRDYIDYHKSRFCDHSLLFYQNNKLIALLPANEINNTLHSHQGLTFGGLLYTKSIKSKNIILLITTLITYLKDNGFCQFIYKPSPAIYHETYSEEDTYALSTLANLSINTIELSSAIKPSSLIKISTVRKRGIKSAKKEGVTIVQDNNNLPAFHQVLTEVLEQTHQVLPVHTLDELKTLMKHFPQNIQLWCAYSKNDQLLAGVITYISAQVAHFQYIASTDAGKKVGALDLLFNKVINLYSEQNKIVDFGKSTEQQGKYLNKGLIYHKESLGGFGVNYYSYKIQI